MPIKKMYLFVVLCLISSTANGNENQMNNEYYSREQCVQQVVSDIKINFNICIKTKSQLDCALSDTEINSMVVAFCGEN
jgi:hypothetical protein